MRSKTCHDMLSQDESNVKKCNAKGSNVYKMPQSSSEEGAAGNFSQFEIAKSVYSSGLLQKYPLSPTAKLVLIALVNHYNPKKRDMFPSQKFMSTQLGISEKSAERAIKDLKAQGLIIYATKKVNHYKFTQKFFEQIKLSQGIRQNGGNNIRQIVGQTNKHEQKNNRGGSFKRGGEVRYNPAMPKGIDYPNFVNERKEVDERTPFNDLDTAKAYLIELKEMLHIPVIKKKVDEVKSHWGQDFEDI